MKSWFKRALPKTNLPNAIIGSSKSGFGAAVAIGTLSLLSYFSGEILLMAPFGASCVLLFAAPTSPLSQPANLIGGHLLASLVSVLFVEFMPDSPYALVLAVFVAVALMAFFRVTHPPAGADPIVIVLGQHSWFFLLFPVFIGSLILFGLALLHHKFISKIAYPTK